MPLYLGALAAGGAVGLAFPAVADPAGAAINPVLGLLLYATFLSVPFARLGQALRDARFLATVLAVNFVLAPPVAWAVTRLVAHDDALLVGALFVLLTPCVDYVIVFTGLAGGARDRLLAAAPLLLVVQMLALPLYLRLFVGAQFAAAVDLTPFVEAFVVLIALPLVAAGLTQVAAARTAWGRARRDAALVAMVPLMMATLAVVVASQVAGVGARLATLGALVPVYVLFAAIMLAVGTGAGLVAGPARGRAGRAGGRTGPPRGRASPAGGRTGRAGGRAGPARGRAGRGGGRTSRLDVPARRAIVFSGVTRNSLVVLPLVLALPPDYALAPLAVVTQTLVELVLMVLMVRLVPRLIGAGAGV